MCGEGGVGEVGVGWGVEAVCWLERRGGSVWGGLVGEEGGAAVGDGW